MVATSRTGAERRRLALRGGVPPGADTSHDAAESSVPRAGARNRFDVHTDELGVLTADALSEESSGKAWPLDSIREVEEPRVASTLDEDPNAVRVLWPVFGWNVHVGGDGRCDDLSLLKPSLEGSDATCNPRGRQGRGVTSERLPRRRAWRETRPRCGWTWRDQVRSDPRARAVNFVSCLGSFARTMANVEAVREGPFSK